MDVVSRHRPGTSSDAGEYVVAGGGDQQASPWVMPLIAVLGVLVGIAVVPVLLRLGGSQDAATVAAAVPTTAPRTATATVAAAPTKRVAVAPTRAPRPSLALAAPPPPAPPSTYTRAASASPTRPADPGNRTAGLEPTSGPAGKPVTISGRCEPGTDARVAAGPAQGQTPAQPQDLAGDGSFRTDYEVPSSAKPGSSVRLVARCLDANGATTYRFDLLYRVTATDTAPHTPSNGSGTGTLEAPDSAGVGDTFGVSGGGFKPGSSVVLQARDAGTGRVLSSGDPAADGNGDVTVQEVTVPGVTGGQRVQLVMTGKDPDGGDRVLTHTITFG